MSTQAEEQMSSTVEQSEQHQQARDWQAAFERLSLDPAEPADSTKARSAAQVAFDDVTNQTDAAEVVTDAVEAGVLEQTGSGLAVADCYDPTPDPEPDVEADTESTQDTDRDELGVAERVERLEEQNKSQAEEIAELQRKNSLLAEAISEFASPSTNRSVFGELPDEMAERGGEMDRLGETINRVNEMLDEVGDLTKDRQETTEGRVMDLRRYMVQEAERQPNNKFGMDYKAVLTYFNSRGADISDSWASQLQTKAAEGHHAFTVDTSGEMKQVRVDADKIDEGSVYRLKNSRENGGD